MSAMQRFARSASQQMRLSLFGIVALALVSAGAGAAPRAWAAGSVAVTALSTPRPGTFHDVAIGSPNDPQGGAVDVTRVDGSRQRLTPSNLLGRSPSGDFNFGAALATAQLNGDNDIELIVSAASRYDVPGSNSVWVLRGTPTGYSSDHMFKLGGHTATADMFGASLEVTLSPLGMDLWVGAPLTDVNGQRNAGAIYHYRLHGAHSATLVQKITEATPHVPGKARAGDRFGEVLNFQSSLYAAQTIVVGEPHRDVHGAVNAGRLVVLHTSAATDLVDYAGAVSQASAGIPGKAEAYDHFGAAVAMDTFRGVVGIPGEDLGNVVDAGAVMELGWSFDGSRLVPTGGPLITQDSDENRQRPAVPVQAQAGDRFGAAVAIGTLACQERSTIAIGAPGDTVDGVADAGSVTLFTPNEPDEVSCDRRVLELGGSLDSSPASGDHFGARLATVDDDPDLEEDYWAVLQIGIPGQDSGATDAGSVLVWKPTGSVAQYGTIGGPVNKSRYGSVLAADGPFWYRNDDE